MKKTIYLLLLVTVFSCSKGVDEPTPQPTPPTPPADCAAYPLKAGNSWVYTSTFYNLNTGAVTNTVSATVTLASASSIGGIPYFSIDSFEYPLRVKYCNTLGLYDAGVNSEVNIKSSYTINDTVVYNSPYSSTRKGVRILGNKDRVKIGNYDCYKLEFQFTSPSGAYYRRRLYYINEKVGLIKSEAFSIQGDISRLADAQEMVSYNLK